jgi:hypothetical protein
MQYFQVENTLIPGLVLLLRFKTWHNARKTNLMLRQWRGPLPQNDAKFDLQII